MARWDRQIATPYAALTDSEKEAHREQVRQYSRVVARGLPGEMN